MVFQSAGESSIRVKDMRFMPFKVPTTSLRIPKALARLRLCAGLPEPLLLTYVISTIFLPKCNFNSSFVQYSLRYCPFQEAILIRLLFDNLR